MRDAHSRKILITAALPYANGDIHMGHLVEYLQADFWARFQKMRGHECYYFCADDTHGTPVMIRAREEGITPEALVARSQQEHMRDFADCEIVFDNYGSTNLPENRELCEQIYAQIKNQNHIEVRSVKQTYCEHDKMFLPDRFIKGSCPRCGAVEQYGDSCDVCSATYSPTDMRDAKCTICGHTPIERESEHIFFKLANFKKFLQDWVPVHTSKEIANKLNEWLAGDLRDWDISRDEPYFGFKIPGTKDKYFYVWVDAPVGYISSTWQWCKKNGRNLAEFWQPAAGGKQTEIYHFLGKDIVYFHALFWPSMLSCAGFKTPDQLFVHGYLTVNGVKMSKSKGTFIAARTYLNHLSPLYLRYYYACKISSGLDDIDFNFTDFVGRVNADLVGKIANLASRGAQMINKQFGGKLRAIPQDGKQLIDKAQKSGQVIADFFEAREFAKGLREIRIIADDANKYFDDKAPWKLIKEDKDATQDVLTVVLNVFRIIAIYLKPIIPSFTAQVEQLFGEQSYSWNSINTILQNVQINGYDHLATRIEATALDKIVEETKASVKKIVKPQIISEKSRTNEADKPSTNEIEIEDFLKVDLRVAKILTAEVIEGADKLLRLTLDVGSEERTVIAGIRTCYKPEELVGRMTVVVANLKPRKMKFGISQGMVLAAGDGQNNLYILAPDKGAKPGDRIK